MTNFMQPELECSFTPITAILNKENNLKTSATWHCHQCWGLIHDCFFFFFIYVFIKFSYSEKYMEIYMNSSIFFLKWDIFKCIMWTKDNPCGLHGGTNILKHCRTRHCSNYWYLLSQFFVCWCRHAVFEPFQQHRAAAHIEHNCTWPFLTWPATECG